MDIQEESTRPPPNIVDDDGGAGRSAAVDGPTMTGEKSSPLIPRTAVVPGDDTSLVEVEVEHEQHDEGQGTGIEEGDMSKKMAVTRDEVLPLPGGESSAMDGEMREEVTSVAQPAEDATPIIEAITDEGKAEMGDAAGEGEDLSAVTGEAQVEGGQVDDVQQAAKEIDASTTNEGLKEVEAQADIPSAIEEEVEIGFAEDSQSAIGASDTPLIEAEAPVQSNSLDGEDAQANDAKLPDNTANAETNPASTLAGELVVPQEDFTAAEHVEQSIPQDHPEGEEVPVKSSLEREASMREEVMVNEGGEKTADSKNAVEAEVVGTGEAEAMESVLEVTDSSSMAATNAQAPATEGGTQIAATEADPTSQPILPETSSSPAATKETPLPSILPNTQPSTSSDLGTPPSRQEETSTGPTNSVPESEKQELSSGIDGKDESITQTMDKSVEGIAISTAPTPKEIPSEQVIDTSNPPAVVSAPSTEPLLNVTTTTISPNLSVAKSTVSDLEAAKQIAMVPLVLKINKELIRVCVDLQGKDLGSDELFKNAALRLQSNLAFLASIADRSTKTPSSMKDAPSTPLNDEPFPPTLHAPDSMLPRLYQILQSFSKTDQSAPTTTNNREAETTKRSRTDSMEGKRKKIKEQQQQQQRQSSVDTIMSSSSSIKQSQQGMMQQGSTSSPIVRPMSATTATPPNQNSDGNLAMVGTAQIPQGIAPVPNGMMSNPQQMQNLTQAFGQNAVMNLNALQAHYRGQPQAVVSYMEANIAGFRSLPIQQQLQQMTNVQNAAMQRQRQQAGLQTNQQQQQQQQQQGQQQQHQHLNRRVSTAQSPGNAESPSTRMTNRSTQSPMPMAIPSPGTPLQQHQGRPSTPASGNPFLPIGSPAASTTSPAPHLMPSSGLSYSSPQNGGGAIGTQSMAPMMANIPAHLQQQFLHQMQLQQQHAYTNNGAFSLPQNPETGNQWPQPPAS